MNAEKRPFLRAAGTVGALTLLSRVLGFVRDVVVTACLGTGRVADLFWIAFEIPNLARRILGEGSLSAFIVPIFTRARKEEGEEAAWRFAANALTTLAFFTLLLTALGMLFAKQLFLIYGYGYWRRGDLEAVAIGAHLTRVMFPFLTLLAVSSILMGLCHSLRRFAAPTLGSSALNVAMIAAGLVFWRAPQTRIAEALAFAVLAGGALRLVLMLPGLRREGFRWHFRLAPSSPRMRRLFLMMGPALFGLAVAQLNISVSRAFATLLGEGYVPCLVVSNRLVQLPLAIIASALATAILPQVASYVAENRLDALRSLTLFAFRLVFLLFVPATVGLMVLGRPLIEVFFERRAFTAQSTIDTYWPLLFYAPGLVSWGLLRIVTPIYYARQNVRTPVLAATAAAFFSLGVNVLVVAVAPLREALGHGGLALANTLGVFLNAGLLQWFLRRQGLRLWDASVAGAFGRSLLASAVMGAAGWFAWRLLAGLAVDVWILRAALLLGVMGFSALVYFAALWIMRAEDLHDAVGVLRRRRTRRKA